MKKTFKFLVCAAAVAGFTACSDSEDINPIGGPDGLERGTLTIYFANPQSYAEDADDATDVELGIRDVRIMTMNTSNKFTLDTVISADKWKPSDNPSENKYSINLQVPLGFQNIYAGINLTSNPKMVGETLKGNLNAQATFSAKDQWDSTHIAQLFAPNAFPMFSNDVKNVNVRADGTSEVTIDVERMVAKIAVKKGETFSDAAVTVGDATFDGSDLTWSIGNSNRMVYPYKKANDNNGKDPNPAYNGSLNSDEGRKYMLDNFVNYFNTTSVNPADWTGFLTTDAIDANNVSNKALHVKYAAENLADNPKVGESTYAVIKAKFTPTAMYTFDKDNPDVTEPKPIDGYKPATPGENAIDTIYAVRTGQKTYYFQDSISANGYKDRLNAGIAEDRDKHKVETFIDHNCFYYVFMGDGKLERNNFYIINVNKFLDLGKPTAEIPVDEVDNPVSGKASLDVTINVIAWIVKVEQHDLY